ncbi:hypothetical protein PRIPAC_77821 [Pristionchus pacificus]|uniref:Uncharacterized protein n=1 Tax=Pristionchus pacificus TaxID=54126 RepID=A0A2A6CPH5_PRIPA|nr:hypothetical protein PRIPAC_77821 [Pristionchus pacificus]|eukprot:PDM80008.1 hypothetical protein PRIPAC_32587 [Pristionchus pacificus]
MQTIVYFFGFFEILIASVTITVCSFLFHLLSKTRRLHTSFRITIRIFAVAVIVYMLLSIVIVVICWINDDISLRYQKPRIDLTPSNIIQQMQQSASFSFWLALSFMTVERSFASHFVSTYENKFSTIRAQALLIALFIFVDFVENLCRVLIPEPTILIVCFSNTFVNLFVMYYIKRVNTKRNVIERDLSYRYQCHENVMISAIFPLTYTLGLLRSKALRKVMISQGFIKEQHRTISEHDQYEQSRNTQNALWKVAK